MCESGSAAYLIINLNKGDSDSHLPVHPDINLLKDVVQGPGSDASPAVLLPLA